MNKRHFVILGLLHFLAKIKFHTKTPKSYSYYLLVVRVWTGEKPIPGMISQNSKVFFFIFHIITGPRARPDEERLGAKAKTLTLLRS